MEISKNINKLDDNMMVLLAVNACNFFEDLYFNKNNRKQDIFLKKHINNFSKYIDMFVLILKKLKFDDDTIDEIMTSIKDKNDAVFPEIENTLIYYYEDEIDFDNDDIIKFCLNPFDLSKLN